MQKQIRKYSIATLTLLIGVMLISLPAFAGTPTVVATAQIVNCSAFCLTFTVNGLGSNYYGAVTASMQYTVTLTSTRGGPPITITGSLTFPTDDSKTACAYWNGGKQPLTDNYTASGTAVLTTSDGQTVTVPITFGSLGTLSCSSSAPPPTLTLAVATTATCTGYCLMFSANNLIPGEADKIVYTMTLTPTAGGPPITVSGEVDFTAPASGTYSINNVCGTWLTSGQNLAAGYTVSGTATLETSAGQSVRSIDFGNSSTLNCGTTPPGKPFSIGPSSMEGNLAISPGDWISGGYNFKFTSGNHPATAYTVTATVTVPVVCPDTSIQNIVIPLGIPGALNGGGATSYTFNIPAGDTTNHASGDQNSILVWEGAVQAPATLCGGNPGNNAKGAIFNATVSQAPSAGLVNWQFHYRDPNAKGKGNVNCTDASNPLRSHADVCGASWSQTITDP